MLSSKKREIEEYIMQKLANNPILDEIIKIMMDQENCWTTKSFGYYDPGFREITLEPDAFRVSCYFHEPVKDNFGSVIGHKKEMIKEAELNYTDFGFIPMHPYKGKSGYIEVSQYEVMMLWARVIRERMQATVPGCYFKEEIVKSKENEKQGIVVFRYGIAKEKFCVWF